MMRDFVCTQEEKDAHLARQTEQARINLANASVDVSVRGNHHRSEPRLKQGKNPI